MKRVIMDVDTGIDDALAICYAARSKSLEILGITTCFGNVSVEEATRNTLNVLDYLELDVPVAQGAGKPIFRHPIKEKASIVHGEDGLGNIHLPDPIKKPVEQHACQFIIEQVKKYPNEVSLIFVGPLTNLALTIMQEPEIVRLVDRVYIMGGAVTVPGNTTMAAEANIYADPEAAEYVFQSGIPITLIGLDVTMKTLLSLEEVEKWKRKNTRLSRFLADITEFYIGFYTNNHAGLKGCGLHDPLAVGVVIDPTFVETKALHVQVDLEGTHTFARTIADFRESSKAKPNVDVCLHVDADRFLKHFLKNIC
ncbi:nucleoside hydrolase [Fictibacillus gelatini]|uniref:nucleoside hydrolase n=1 Tax=Fictibacillus gelatini TaxID=225985 RepID=UPI00040A975E|nr:nucleoside hydrolase [Fictibacillus gelatini]